LALVGWFGITPRPVQKPEAQTPFLTRQILKASPTPIPATPIAHQPTEHPVLSTKQPANTTILATSIPKPAEVTPQLEAASPLTMGADTETASALKTDKTTPATTSSLDTGADAKTATSNEMYLPSSHAEYLNNPQPSYPALSLRLHETGQVVLRVLIGKNGQALRGDVFHTSGFHRLDQSALKAVLSWRYVPGKVNGQAQDMWFDIPISFKLPN
jgi:periplasmic protein TonB